MIQALLGSGGTRTFTDSVSVQEFEGDEVLMSDLTQSIVVAASAALLSTVGALWTQIIAARINRRNTLDDRRLDALVDVRQKIEIAHGRWQGWAYVSVMRPDNEDPAARLELAGDAMHEAWYATNLFELYFPSMAVMMGEFRDSILRKRDIARRQVKENAFNPDEFKDIGPSLDELTRRGRSLLKMPEL